jgi:integrase
MRPKNLIYMPSLKLTSKAINALPAPDPSGCQKLYFDSELKGFGVLCSGKTATKSYVVQKDLKGGKTRRVTIGAVNVLGLDAARTAAREALALIFRGIDPKAPGKRSATLRGVLTEFLAARPNLREKTRLNYLESTRLFEDWLDRPLVEITREAVEKRHRQIADEVRQRRGSSGSASANGAMRTVSALWSFAADRDPELPPNPVRLRKQWLPEPRRETYVAVAELPRFYAAVRNLHNDVGRDYLTLLLFTGLRRREAASLRWDDIDLVERVMKIPAGQTKAGRTLTLPLSDFVYEMLAARRAIGKTTFVFPSIGRSGHIEEPKSFLAAIAAACGVRVSVHDLRRTFITIAESCDVGGYVLKVLVNHSMGSDVTSGYIQLTPERLREPVQKIATKMLVLCGVNI